MINKKYLLYIFQENRTKKKVQNEIINNDVKNNGIVSFLIKKTELPDIYELYCSKNEALFKVGIAGVNTLSCSLFIKNLFNSSKENVYVSSSYHKDFKKWIPYKESDSITSYELIKNVES